MSNSEFKKTAFVIRDQGHRRPANIGLIIALSLGIRFVSAGPCEDAERYEELAQQSAQEAYDYGMSMDVGAAWGATSQAYEYRALAEQAAARCAQSQNQRATAPRTTTPKTQSHGARGYGPERTGFEWKPFLADLRPKAVASQLRQGDSYAKKGDWANAAKYYDQAARIEPKNQRARQKANDAHQKANQPESPAAQPPAPPPPPPSVPASQPATAPSAPPPEPVVENQSNAPPVITQEEADKIAGVELLRDQAELLAGAGQYREACDAALAATQLDPASKPAQETLGKMLDLETMDRTLDDKALRKLFESEDINPQVDDMGLSELLNPP